MNPKVRPPSHPNPHHRISLRCFPENSQKKSIDNADAVIHGATLQPLQNHAVTVLAGVYCENGQNACKLLLICMLLCHSCITHVGYYRADQGPELESVSAASGFV